MQDPMISINKKLPVTVLSGFLGSGKTTLLKNILLNAKQKGLKYAILVNDMATLNIDAELIKSTGSVANQTKQKMVQLQGGCICCSLREDLLKEVRQLALANSFDYLVIESTGIAEPLPIAQTFTFTSEMMNEMVGADNDNDKQEQQHQHDHNHVHKHGGHKHDDKKETQKSTVIPQILSDVAQLDTMVTLIDAANFFEYLQSQVDIKALEQRLVSKGEVIDEEDERSVAHLLIDQIQFANVILLNKIDLVKQNGEQNLVRIEEIIKKINPQAKVFRTIKSNIQINEIINTHLFDFDQAALNPFWLKQIRGEEKKETDQYGITSLIYRRRTPFDPQKLCDFINSTNLLKQFGIVRSKGFVWLASRNQFIFEWAGAGNIFTIEQAGLWYAVNKAQNNEEWSYLNEQQKALIQKDFEGEYGDRRQQIVLIYFKNKSSKEQIEAALDTYLVKPDVYEKGPNFWEQSLEFPVDFGGDSVETMKELQEGNWEDQDIEDDDDADEEADNGNDEIDDKEKDSQKDN